MLKTHAELSVENSMRNEGTSRSPENFIYQLTTPITFTNRSKDKQYFCRIQNVRIPITFYGINSNYNVFTFNDNGTNYNVTVTPGNYTIDELITELQTLMNATASLTTYTITYDENTQKITISSDGGGGITTITASGNGATNTLYKLIGFSIGQTIPDAGSATGDNVAYTNTTGYLKIVLDNIVSSNLYANDENKQTQLQKVGVIIPITQTRNEFQYYDNNDGPLIKLSNMSSLKDFKVKLVDRYNNEVSLNGAPWGFEIIFYEWNR